MNCCGCGKGFGPWPLAPIGYRFLPTDEELLIDYLRPKVVGYPITAAINIISEIDEIELQNYNPMQLQDRALEAGDGSFYFFTKNRQGLESLQQRRDGDGYWQATSVVESITDQEGRLIGTKKAFIYHFNLNNNDNSWTMYEYCLPRRSSMEQQNQQQQWLLAKLENNQQKQEYERRQEAQDRFIEINEEDDDDDNDDDNEEPICKRFKYDGA